MGLREATSAGTHRRQALDIPTSWTSAHLAMRIRDHFGFWKRTPGGAGPAGRSGFWPAYLHTAKDITGYINKDGVPQHILDLGDPLAEHIKDRNRRTVPLDGFEVRIRDVIQDYLIEFGKDHRDAHDLIVFDCRMAADGYGLRDRARGWGMAKSTFDEARKRALNHCCIFLNERGRPVL